MHQRRHRAKSGQEVREREEDADAAKTAEQTERKGDDEASQEEVGQASFAGGDGQLGRLGQGRIAEGSQRTVGQIWEPDGRTRRRSRDAKLANWPRRRPTSISSSSPRSRPTRSAPRPQGAGKSSVNIQRKRPIRSRPSLTGSFDGSGSRRDASSAMESGSRWSRLCPRRPAAVSPAAPVTTFSDEIAIFCVR